MITPISGDMHFVPPPRQKRSGSDGERVSFEQYLVENVDAVERDPSGKDGKEQAGDRGEHSRAQVDELDDSGSKGSEPGANVTLQGRRIDLRA